MSAPDPRRWWAMACLLLANFMNLIDVTIVNVALPSMERGLGATSSEIEWVSAIYVLCFALGLLPFGRLGDIVGRKRMFLAGCGLFTLGSALCGLAPDIDTLIAARAFQGIGAAVMTPQVLAIAQVIFPPEERSSAFSLFGVTASLASVSGPLIGGALIFANVWDLGWRPIFLVNVPIGILAIAAGMRLIPPTPSNPALRMDFAGVAIFGAAIILMVFPLIEGRVYGWPWWIFALMAGSVLSGALFVWWQHRRAAGGRTQLLPVTLIGNRTYALGVFVTMMLFSGIPGLFLILAIFFQSGFGLTPLESGLATMPFPCGVLLASFISGRLGSRFLRARLSAGAGLLAVGMAFLHFTISRTVAPLDHWDFVPPLLVCGTGMGLTVASLFQTILAGVPPQDAGSGSGALQAFQQVGAALGIALVGQIFFSTLEGQGSHVQAATNATWYQIAMFSVMFCLVPFLRKRQPEPARP
ncbi:MFS transporter [Cereibacter sp. SYSU M97828]|nr:MFS transporter [Cereibacter flavus]